MRWKGINCSGINFQLKLRLNLLSFAYRERKLAHSCCQHSNWKVDLEWKVSYFVSDILKLSWWVSSCHKTNSNALWILDLQKIYTGIIHIGSIQAIILYFLQQSLLHVHIFWNYKSTLRAFKRSKQMKINIVLLHCTVHCIAACWT